MEEALAHFSRMFEKHFKEELADVLSVEDCNSCQSVVLSVAKILDLDEICAVVGNMLLKEPLKTMPAVEAVVLETARRMCRELDSRGVKLQRDFRVRFNDLPHGEMTLKKGMPTCSDRGRLVGLRGTVSKVTAPLLLDHRRNYICKKCKYQCLVKADFTRYYAMTPPQKCPNPLGCDSFSLVCVETRDCDTSKDYQEIRITESVDDLPLGMMPQSLWVVLEDDLVGRCQAGDDVSICGVVRMRCKSLDPGDVPDSDLVIHASYVQVRNERWKFAAVRHDLHQEFEAFWANHADRPWYARDVILKSFCPQIYGMYPIKLSVALVIAGGVPTYVDTETKMRGESHLLLVGDPGTGKSQFLKYAAKLCERSVLTTGIGSTSAGLTVSCGHDMGSWQLEPGALVLADGGICCIDEFNSMRAHDLTSIHEAMEQQTISVAKAGMVSKLNTRCTIIAATNPKGNYDRDRSLSVNTGLGSPLLSRFDLVFVLLDNHNMEWDRTVSSFILDGENMKLAAGMTKEAEERGEIWGIERMRAYFSIVKSKEPTTISPYADRMFSAYYHHQRKSRTSAHTTVRLLESLLRIAQANAKLMWRETVELLDAVVAISLMESSMMSTGLLGNLGALNTAFPGDPEAEYSRLADEILKKLGIPDLAEVDAEPSSIGGAERSSGPSQPPAALSSSLERSRYEPRAAWSPARKRQKRASTLREMNRETTDDQPGFPPAPTEYDLTLGLDEEEFVKPLPLRSSTQKSASAETENPASVMLISNLSTPSASDPSRKSPSEVVRNDSSVFFASRVETADAAGLDFLDDVDL